MILAKILNYLTIIQILNNFISRFFLNCEKNVNDHGLNRRQVHLGDDSLPLQTVNLALNRG
jgi:hypothetical protein